MTRTLIAGCLIVASLLLAACETTGETSKRPPAQAAQKPAHQMHYPASAY